MAIGNSFLELSKICPICYLPVAQHDGPELEGCNHALQALFARQQAAEARNSDGCGAIPYAPWGPVNLPDIVKVIPSGATARYKRGQVVTNGRLIQDIVDSLRCLSLPPDEAQRLFDAILVRTRMPGDRLFLRMRAKGEVKNLLMIRFRDAVRSMVQGSDPTLPNWTTLLEQLVEMVLVDE